jgi:tetratricopeptide (TPR) repeat protein
MFVFLALVFGVGFVVFGIGANQSASLGDLLRDSGGATGSGISLSDAREQVQENPKSAEAQRNLATALQEEGETEEAITVLTRYVALRPKDADALRELAGLQLGRGSLFAQQAQEAQVRASYYATGDIFGGQLQGPDAQATGSSPIDDAVTSRATQEVTNAYTKAQQAFTAAVATYDKLVATAPKDPNIRLELAQAAQQSGDYAKAIAAYQEFLKLAPDDPSASIVKQQVAQLKAAQAPPSSG